MAQPAVRDAATMPVHDHQVVAEHHRAVRARPELELGVGEDDPALTGDPLGPGVDVEGQTAQLAGPLQVVCAIESVTAC